MKHRKAILTVIVIAGLGAAFFFLAPRFGANAADPADARGGERAANPVEVAPATTGDLQEYLRLNGDVRASSTVDVLPDTAGELVSVDVRVGQFVRRDQILGSVDSSRPGSTFVASPIRAPISGTVTRIVSEIGATVAQSMPVFQISQLSSLEIVAQVAERDVWKVEPGQRVYVEVASAPGRVVTGRVAELSPVIDARSRTMEITISLNESVGILKSGMLTNLTIVTGSEEDTVRVPEQALLQRGGTSAVYRVNGDTVDLVPVETGLRIDGLVQILSGLADGDLVVTAGQTLLSDGAAARIVGQEEGAAPEGNLANLIRRGEQ
jgi:membrane fusion protein (multidrug efflux system)